MSSIQTVRGPIDPGELGVTYAHEHLLFRLPEPYHSQDPDLCLDDVEVAVAELGFFAAAGGRAVVDMGTPDTGRSPAGLLAIAERSGIHVIAATGFNKGRFCEAMVADRSVMELAEGMARDLLQGMDGTGIKAGLIKASSSLDGLTPGEEKVFQAAIRAHRLTGAPISTHTEAGTWALDQIALLLAGGVSPEHILVGHLDRKLDRDYLRTVAQTGVFLGFDQFSKEKYFPDAQRIAVIKELTGAGHGSQIVISGDLARKSYWPSYGFGHGPGFTYLLWRVVPWMLEVGISRSTVEQVLVENPARFFRWAR